MFDCFNPVDPVGESGLSKVDLAYESDFKACIYDLPKLGKVNVLKSYLLRLWVLDTIA